MTSGTLITVNSPDSKDHGTYMGPTWVLSAPGGPHVGSVVLAIWAISMAIAIESTTILVTVPGPPLLTDINWAITSIITYTV